MHANFLVEKNRTINLISIYIVKLDCDKGEVPLTETQKCSLNGYTCLLTDGPDCCMGRATETRSCIPCDETHLAKPSGYTAYTTAGTCDYDSGNIFTS